MTDHLRSLLKPLARWEGALVLVLVLELLVFGALNPRFLDGPRLVGSTSDFVYLGIIALPLAIVMMTGGIDISVGSIVSLSAIVTGVTFANGVGIWLACAAGMAAALAAGLVNGVAILLTGANPMVITLGTQFLFAGLAVGISGLADVSSFEGISGLPDAFVDIANGRLVPGVPNPLLIFALVAAVFTLLLHATSFGRQARLIGANPRTAVYSGFSVPRITLVAYLLTAAGSGVAGLLLTSYLASARADIGGSVLLPVLTLVVIGGVSMFGGEGTIGGVVVATFVIGFLQQGLRFAGMTESQVAVATGTALVLVASLRWWSSHLAERLKNQRARRRRTPSSSAPAAQVREPEPLHGATS
ncbi:ABC transporter permease subunit [Cellulomonas endometrii]|uniref:ABC transporter permease subunit n=1 Tax=Cellulomonas endometrii TaxID=3036301 RepID=UPI0024AE169B|nr:autoinducer 2 import system permease LsrD [Cellulomonas endometrii]